MRATQVKMKTRNNVRIYRGGSKWESWFIMLKSIYSKYYLYLIKNKFGKKVKKVSKRLQIKNNNIRIEKIWVIMNQISTSSQIIDSNRKVIDTNKIFKPRPKGNRRGEEKRIKAYNQVIFSFLLNTIGKTKK